MANIKQPKNELELKQLTLANLRKAYLDLADVYEKIINNELSYCPKCGKWKSSKPESSNFYSNKNNIDGIEHYGCRACILDECTDYDKKTKIRTDNKDKTIEVFKRLNWCFKIDDYNAQLAAINESVGEKNRGTAVQQLIVMVRSLPQYKFKTFKDSEFGVDDLENNTEESTKLVQKTLKAAKKRFGNGYSNEDYMFLENQYQDWITRFECNTKTQEEIFERLSFKKLEIHKATLDGKSTKDLDRTYQDLMNTANITPRQTSMDAMADAQTFGTLIQKYENERPLPEIDPELQDVDKIGLYIDTFYRGHASKMLGLKNAFSNLYEKVMSKYTVKPPEYGEDSDSELIFEKIFGNVED